MCVICIKEAGVMMPTYKKLKAMAKANPDGFGVATPSVYYRTMEFSDFYHVLKTIPQSEPAILHFRWATHGSNKVSNCHPFHSKGVYFAHNGVLSIPSVNDKTDSEICFETKVLPMIEEVGIDKARPYIDSVREGTRFAILKDGKVHTYGQYYKEDGCMYSNLRWHSCLAVPRTRFSSNYQGWFGDYWM